VFLALHTAYNITKSRNIQYVFVFFHDCIWAVFILFLVLFYIYCAPNTLWATLRQEERWKHDTFVCHETLLAFNPGRTFSMSVFPGRKGAGGWGMWGPVCMKRGMQSAES